jgi:hypothetical protein
MEQPSPEPEDDDRFYTHLLTLMSVSAGMVGVCLTAIGLVGIAKRLGNLETLVDDCLALGTLLFMLVTVLSFLGIRTGLRRVWRGYALTLDILFCLALAVLVTASMLLTWVVL